MKANMATYDYEDLVKCGYLEMKLPREQRKMTQKTWKRKWFVLRRKSKYGWTRLEYCRSEESCVNGKHKTVIPLSGVKDIKHVHSRTHQYAFQIASNEIKIFLSGDNERETKEWIRLMKELVLPEPKMLPLIQGGDIYGLFEVSVINNKDSERMGLSGDYLITVKNEYLCLYSTKTGNNVLQWELEHLPWFRLQRLSQLQDKDKVLITKVAKGCKSGEGEFHFLTRQGKEILDSIKCQTKRLFSSRHINLHRESTQMRRPSMDSVPCTRSSSNETGDSLTSASCCETDSRERSISMSSHPSTQSGQQSSGQQSSGPQSSEKQSPRQPDSSDIVLTQQLPRQQDSTMQLPRQQDSTMQLPRQLSKEQRPISSEVQLPKRNLLIPCKTYASELSPGQQLPRQRMVEQRDMAVVLQSCSS